MKFWRVGTKTASATLGGSDIIIAGEVVDMNAIEVKRRYGNAELKKLRRWYEEEKRRIMDTFAGGNESAWLAWLVGNTNRGQVSE